MRPVDWRELKRICEEEHCRFDRQRGDHYVMTREGLARPVVFPMKKDLREDIVLGVARLLGLSKREIEVRLGIRRGARQKSTGSGSGDTAL